MFIIHLLLLLTVVLVPKPVGFQVEAWENGLQGYSDADYILSGIQDGFDIGWIDGAEPTRVRDPYIPTSETEKLEITRWIAKRHASGILLGPFTEKTCPFDDVYYAPIFTVLKPDFVQRIVVHLSYPVWGTSVNDCIEDEAKKVSYIYFVAIAKFVYELGYDARLWVVDAKDAYYRVPVKKKYWKYMGLKWFGLIFIFTSLQMGLGSACAIYQRFADAILYIIKNNSSRLFIGACGQIYIFHYLDDFFGGHPSSYTAWLQLFSVVEWFSRLGIPTQWKKLKFPHWQQVILGWLWIQEQGLFRYQRAK